MIEFPLKNRWCDVILFVVAFALYAPSLQNGFVGDDIIYFINNAHIRSFDVKTILLSGATGADYLPLRDLSFALDYLLWGNDPFGFHLMNVALFGITVIAVRRLFSALNAYLLNEENMHHVFISCVAAAIFAVHPNHREVVYAIFNRGALLTTLFSVVTLMAFTCYLRTGGKRTFLLAGAVFSFILALLSREYCITLPLVLALMVTFDRRTRHTRNMIALVPFFLASGVFFIVFRQYAVAGKFIPASGSLLSEGIPKAAMAAKIMFFYFFRVFTNLGSFDFDHSQLLTPLSGTVVAWALLGAILQKRKRPQLLFGLLFYLLCLIPVLNLYKTQPLVSPRYSFLPCLGLYFAVMAMPFRGKGKYLSLFCAAATFLWTLMTMHKTDYWKNNVTFWELMASRDKTEFSYQQLGYAYSEAGQYAKARDALKMVWPQPPSPNFFAALGRACFESGDYQCAIQAYENVLTLDPGNDSALPYLASSYKAAGDRQSVQRVFSKLRK